MWVSMETRGEHLSQSTDVMQRGEEGQGRAGQTGQEKSPSLPYWVTG